MASGSDKGTRGTNLRGTSKAKGRRTKTKVSNYKTSYTGPEAPF